MLRLRSDNGDLCNHDLLVGSACNQPKSHTLPDICNHQRTGEQLVPTSCVSTFTLFDVDSFFTM